MYPLHLLNVYINFYFYFSAEHIATALTAIYRMHTIFKIEEHLLDHLFIHTRKTALPEILLSLHLVTEQYKDMDSNQVE